MKKKTRKSKQNQLVIGMILGLIVLFISLGLLVTMLFGKKEEAESFETVEITDVEETSEEFQEESTEVEESVKTYTIDLKENPNEIEGESVGIDVSEHQGNIDWTQVVGSGIDFAIVRLGYRNMSTGEITEDACARYNLQEAVANNLLVGAYFFSTAITEDEAREEAKWVADLLEGYPITYPVAYNCEGFQNSDSRQYGLTVEERSKIADAFLDEIETQGYVGMFYAAKNELEANTQWNADFLAANYRTWVAQYLQVGYPEQRNPEYSKTYEMWQYTNKGTIPGVGSDVDINVAYFSYSQAGKALGEEAQEVEPNLEVGVIFTEMEVTVTAKDEVNLRSSMNQDSEANIVTKLQNGDQAVKTGEGNNGWARLEYNGQILYAVAGFLTEDLSYVTPVAEKSEFKTKFATVSENVTAKEVTNLRNRPSVEAPSEVIAELTHGEVILRTGISDMGWSRVEYNGQTLYCVGSYLEIVE